MSAHPESIGKYDIEAFLGGGMSHVYRARDRVLGRTVCVKVLMPEGAADQEVRERFLMEARMAGNFCHDNVVSIYDFGEDNGNPYLVMEYLRGETLRGLMDKHAVGGLRQALQICLQLSRALECVHAQNIIHRDIKPENVHVNSQGTVKLMDFGIAKAHGLNITQAGFILGTPYYMAPEQIRGAEITPLIDVYSFGVLMYELLAGRKPYNAETPEAIFYAILNANPDPAPLAEAGVPEAVRNLIARCMSKTPAERPASFNEVGSQIESIIASLSLETVVQPAPHIEPKKPPVVWYAVAGVAVIAALVGVFLVTRKPALAKTLTDPAGDMLLVDAGEFIVGEPPVHKTLPAFYIDKTEVTNGAWSKFCQATGCAQATAAADLPVTGITIDQARQFARWAHKRLPSYDEWEKAARWTDGRKYPWGDAEDASRANVNGSALATVSDFVSGASKYGALQMSGNAAELVDGSADPTPRLIQLFSVLNPPATAAEPWVFVRGGSYHSKLPETATYEFARVPARFTSPDIGFRCARDPAH